MFSKDRWNEILEALNANRFRTLLTAFGVFWGILILVLLLALTNGLKNGVSADFGDFATNSMFMWSQGTSMSYKGLPKGRYFNFKLEDVDVLREKYPQLKYISPRNQLGGYNGANNVTYKEKTGAYSVYGDYPEFIKQQPQDITSGRYISYSDIEEKRKICVIGEDVVKGLYDKGEEPLNTYIKINGVNFLVVGTFRDPKSSGDAEESANTIFVPFTTFS
ncbi:ABC transporter permease, partial [Dokdonia donghaensis]|uniref:ABC transporter permease n=1 Tax=Dokdonia donghaensis TaxID=326320 RepID=UPI0035C7F8E5